MNSGISHSLPVHIGTEHAPRTSVRSDSKQLPAKSVPANGDSAAWHRTKEIAGLCGGFGTALILPGVLTGTFLSYKSFENSNKSVAIAEISLAQQLKNSNEIRAHIDDTSAGLANHGERVQAPKMMVPLHENLMNQISARQPQPQPLSINAAAAAHESASNQ